jgi:transcription initiation factor TFIIIB Brf1 subunit/transcription initiation factor TFIIB
MIKIKYKKPCPVCKSESEIFPEDYENRFFIKCSHCGKYYTEQTMDEKMNFDDHPYFKKIERQEDKKALISFIRNNLNPNEPPFVKRHEI